MGPVIAFGPASMGVLLFWCCHAFSASAFSVAAQWSGANFHFCCLLPDISFIHWKQSSKFLLPPPPYCVDAQMLRVLTRDIIVFKVWSWSGHSFRTNFCGIGLSVGLHAWSIPSLLSMCSLGICIATCCVVAWTIQKSLIISLFGEHIEEKPTIEHKL